MQRKILMKMNNIRLRNKVILLFIICVMIPLISTNVSFFRIMKQGMEREQELKIKNIAEQLEFELRDTVNNQISIADYLNRNEKLNEFLERQYPDASSYYDAYVQLMSDDVIHYYYLILSANNVTISTGNDTIINGTYFVKKEEVENSSWYQKFREGGSQLCFYSYYEDGKESGGYVEKGRKMVIMQKLDYCGEDNMIMLDLDYRSMQEKFELLCDGLDCRIFAGQTVLFSTEERNNAEKEFLLLDSAEREEYSIEKNLKLYGEDITICFKPKQYGISDIVRGIEGYMLLFLYALDLLLPSVVLFLLYHSLNDRISMVQEYLNRIKEGIYEVIPCEEGTDEIGCMIRCYNLMTLRIKELVEVVFKNKEREQSLVISKKQAELNALQSQLNPHFIFNALESIRMHSILKQETETARILENFAVLMRKNIQWNQDFVSIEEECDNVERYLEIQKYRFGERLEYFLYIQEECRKRMIPRFIIITFVENACVHGIERSVEGGSITVMVSEDEDCLYFEIMDSGSGMEPEELDTLRELVKQADIGYIQKAKKSIGIVNAAVRMKQYYGDGVQIDIKSTKQEGTEIGIQIPKDNGRGTLEGNGE